MVNDLVRQVEVTAEQVHIGRCDTLGVGPGDDHHVERLGKILVQRLRLINVGLRISSEISFHQMLVRDVM
jgi:hypothetical protein